MSIEIQRTEHISVNDINSLIKDIVLHSGGASDEDLMNACTQHLHEDLMIPYKDIETLYGTRGVLDPVQYRNDYTPIMNGLEMLTPTAFSKAVNRNKKAFIERVRDCLEDSLDGYILDHFSTLFGLSISEGQRDYFDESLHDSLRERTKEYVQTIVERLKVRT